MLVGVLHFTTCCIPFPTVRSRRLWEVPQRCYLNATLPWFGMFPNWELPESLRHSMEHTTETPLLCLRWVNPTLGARAVVAKYVVEPSMQNSRTPNRVLISIVSPTFLGLFIRDMLLNAIHGHLIPSLLINELQCLIQLFVHNSRGCFFASAVAFFSPSWEAEIICTSGIA